MGIRQVHAYLSVFAAPTIVFFALTGALQVFSLHEAHGDYRPPPLVRALSHLHKDQRLTKPPRRAASALQSPVLQGDWIAPVAEPAPEPAAPAPLRQGLLKLLAAAAALAMSASACLGVWMALTVTRNRGLLGLTLLAGVAAPLALILL